MRIRLDLAKGESFARLTSAGAETPRRAMIAQGEGLLIDSQLSAAASTTDGAASDHRATTLPIGGPSGAQLKWDARLGLAKHRANTERMCVLAEFLSRPIHAHGGSEPDPDIITAYNLAVEAALQAIRRAAVE